MILAEFATLVWNLAKKHPTAKVFVCKDAEGNGFNAIAQGGGPAIYFKRTSDPDHWLDNVMGETEVQQPRRQTRGL